MNLLNVDANAKTVKGQKKGYLTGILYLAPSTISGFNVCPYSKLAGCENTCLNRQGRGGMAKDNITFRGNHGWLLPDNNIQRARIRKTKLFFRNQTQFMAQLEKDIHALIRKGKRENLTPVVRLNGTSDIQWEHIRNANGQTIFEVFPDIQFYDYTKIPTRKNLPQNYHLTWSYSEATDKYMNTRPDNMNWAVVFKTKDFPDTFQGRTVINGDENDLRFLDANNVVVGLKAKGTAKHETNGFVIEVK